MSSSTDSSCSIDNKATQDVKKDVATGAIPKLKLPRSVLNEQQLRFACQPKTKYMYVHKEARNDEHLKLFDDDPVYKDWAIEGTWPDVSVCNDKFSGLTIAQRARKNYRLREFENQKKDATDTVSAEEKEANLRRLDRFLENTSVRSDDDSQARELVVSQYFCHRWVEQQNKYIPHRLENIEKGIPVDQVNITPVKFSDLLIADNDEIEEAIQIVKELQAEADRAEAAAAQASQVTKAAQETQVINAAQAKEAQADDEDI